MTGFPKPAAALVALRGLATPAPPVPLGPVPGPVVVAKPLPHLLSAPGAAPALTAAPQPGLAASPPRAAPWSALVSAGLHAGAALALIAAPVWLDAGAAGEAGLDSLSRPEPPAVQVTLMTPADLLPDLAPEVPTVTPDTLPDTLTETAPETPEVELAVETPLPPADTPLLRPDLPQADAPPADDGAFSAPPLPKPVEKLADKPVEKKVKKKKRPAAPQEVVSTKAAGTGGGAVSGASGKAADSGAGAASETDLKTAWGGKIRSRIEARKSTPRGADGATGTVKVQLVVARSGKLLSASVVASSGHAALDQAALAAVRAAGRFPAAPKGLARDSYSFTLPMRYN